MKLRLTSALALAAVPAMMASSALAQAGPGYDDGHMWGGGWHGWFFGPLMMVFWLVIMVGAVLLVLRLCGVAGGCGRCRRKAGSDAVDILRERFARGEIDKAEFEERRALLER